MINLHVKFVGCLVVGTICFAFGSISGHARPHRVQQVPNGDAHGCQTCHSPVTTSIRNDFGQMIEADYLDLPGAAGNVQWGAELAGRDADSDGRTNGEELLDPNGTWPGGTDPGNPAEVTNPGVFNSQSVPALSSLGLLSLALGLGAGGSIRCRRRGRFL